MDCYAYCTASYYPIKRLHAALKGQHSIALIHNVLHLELPDQEGDVYYFSYGSVIFWDVKEETRQTLLKELREIEEEPVSEIETDYFSVKLGDKPKIEEDEIIIADREMMTKLAISHGLAQSVKLGVFEDTLAHTFQSTRLIPEALAKQGKVPLSRKQIRQKMGELFLERSSINLQVDLLDTPEFFWEYPELEKLYELTANELEIETRGEILNQRLDVLKELFEMLGTEVNHQHSNRLEWAIIWLIVAEVILSLLTIFKMV